MNNKENPSIATRLGRGVKNAKNKKFDRQEILIISLIIGTICSLISGFYFAEEYYISEVKKKYYSETDSIFSINRYNYVIGIATFIITAGLSFLFLKRKEKEMN